MVYASYTKGFKPGGSNLTFGYPMDAEGFGAAPAPQLIFPFFESEMIDAYEVGLKTDFLDDKMTENSLSVPLKEAREKFEKEYLTIQLKKFNGNISKTANFVGMERSALHRKLKGLGIKEFN